MKKLLLLGLLATACTKPTHEDADATLCHPSARVYVETQQFADLQTGSYEFVVQEFVDGTKVNLAVAGQNYTAYKNTCEL